MFFFVVSQMDSANYVPISVLSNFNQVCISICFFRGYLLGLSYRSISSLALATVCVITDWCLYISLVSFEG